MNHYPGMKEADLQRTNHKQLDPNDEEPDFVGMAPNYDKFVGWTPEEVLVFLNID